MADDPSGGSVHGIDHESARPNRVAERPLRENGVPIRTVIMLTPDGGGMRMAQMRDNSQAIERGTGKKQP